MRRFTFPALLSVLVTAQLLLSAPRAVLAVDATDGTNPATNSGGLTNPLNGINSLPQLLDAILKAVVQIGSIILVLALVYVGFQFVVAQGNEEKLKSARGALMWTVIGGLVLLGAQVIESVILSTVQAL